MNADNPTFAALLEAAVTEPGKIHGAYFAFHGYSIGNQLLALIQCAERGITPGPIASFHKWKERGRHVVKGQKAIALWMPITVKRTIEQQGAEPEQVAFTRFLLKRNWFVLSQTAGEEFTPEQIPSWDRTQALQALGIEEIPFDHTDGNVWGFARGKQVAVSPCCGFGACGWMSGRRRRRSGECQRHSQRVGRCPRSTIVSATGSSRCSASSR